MRYLDVVAAPGGDHRLYEAPLPDGSHELHTEQVSAPPAPRVDVRLSRQPDDSHTRPRVPPIAPRARYSRDGSQLLWRPTAARELYVGREGMIEPISLDDAAVTGFGASGRSDPAFSPWSGLG